MEQRQHERIVLDDRGWRAQLVDRLDGNRLGEIVNISPWGLMLLTPLAIEVETRFQAQCVAVDPDGREERFDANLLVLWNAQAGQQDTYWVGMQIIDIDTASRDGLDRLRAAMASPG